VVAAIFVSSLNSFDSRERARVVPVTEVFSLFNYFLIGAVAVICDSQKKAFFSRKLRYFAQSLGSS